MCVSVCVSGLLSILCVCGVHIRYYMSALHPRAVAVLCGQHIRVGAVRVAHR